MIKILNKKIIFFFIKPFENGKTLRVDIAEQRRDRDGGRGGRGGARGGQGQRGGRGGFENRGPPRCVSNFCF